MISVRRTLVVGFLSLVTFPAFAQFGSLLGGGAKGGGDIDGQVKSFSEKSMKVEMLMNKALLAVLAAYQKDEDRAKTQAQFDELGKATDPKEAGAKFQEVYKSSEAKLKELTASSDLSARTAQLSAEKQQQVAKGVGNFLIGALQSKDLVSTGQNIVQGVSSNPMNIPKVVPVKDVLPRLGNAISLAAGTIPQFMKVLQGANIKVADVGASSKEEPLDKI